MLTRLRGVGGRGPHSDPQKVEGGSAFLVGSLLQKREGPYVGECLVLR